jgi:hypothetical protein
MNISIRQLSGFVHVARLGGFTRAAEQSHITQAGLSAMIRDLEALLGCRLCPRDQCDLAYMAQPAAPLPYYQDLRKRGCTTAPPRKKPLCQNRICVSRDYLISKRGRRLPETARSFVQTFVEVAARLCGA